MALTVIEIRNAKTGVHADGGGLYLCVKSGGTKSWIFRYQLAGRRREMGLGSLGIVQPTEARAEAARLKALVKQGVDPLDAKEAHRADLEQIERAERQEQRLQGATFSPVADSYIASQEAGWRNAKHRQQWTNTLKTYAYPVIGALPVNSITTEHMLAVLEPIWSTKSETAGRVRMRMETVLNAAKVMGLRQGDNPALWRGGLEALLPRLSKVQKVRHHPAMDWRATPVFFADLTDQDGMGARALRFAILTAARSGEVRMANWLEFDLDARLWTVPATRMKAGRAHRVPLSDAAMALLSELPKIIDCDLLFPGLRNQPLSDMSLSAVLKRMKINNATVHGFRSSFRDWAAEITNYHPETVEIALAHSVGSKTERSYRREDQLDKRRLLMEEWALWLKTKPVAK